MEAKIKIPCRFFLSGSCLKGEICNFEHSALEQIPTQSSYKRPDLKDITNQTKQPCRFFMAGNCRYGDACFYSHDASLKNAFEDKQTEEGDLCTVCYEKPLMYGLLLNCNHSFCLQCVRKWRKTKQNVDPLDSTIKASLLCPVCRAFSMYVVPSLVGFPKGGEGKQKTIELYHQKLATIDCRYFMNSSSKRRFCPFGDECFYRHPGNAAGERYVFGPSFHRRLLKRRENRRVYSSFFGGDELLFAEFGELMTDQTDWINELDDYSDYEPAADVSDHNSEPDIGDMHALETLFRNLASSDWLEYQNNPYIIGYSQESSEDGNDYMNYHVA